MSLVTGRITSDGALVDVFIGVSRNRQKRLEGVRVSVPTKIPVLALIDTGSFATAFMPNVYRALGIEPFNVIKVRSATTKLGEPCLTDQYDVSVTLLSGDRQHVLPSVHAIVSEDFDDDPHGPQALIGRDVLDHCAFSYYGPHKEFTLAF